MRFDHAFERRGGDINKLAPMREKYSQQNTETMKIIIGSDEMILWLRKNQRAINISNDVIGKRIRNILKDFGSNPIEYDKQTHWANETGDKNISHTNLPKTSAQYEIDIADIENIYQVLSDEF